MAWDGSTRAKRLPPGWKRTVRRILKRDHGICHVCGKPGADQVDHVNAGDDHSDANLAAIHYVPCHRDKSSSEGGRAAAAKRGSRFRPRERHPGLI